MSTEPQDDKMKSKDEFESKKGEPDTSAGSNDQSEGGLFTQDQINAIIAKERRNWRKSEMKAFAEGLGLEGEEDIEKLVNAAREYQQNQMSELEKAQAEVQRLRDNVKQLEDQISLNSEEFRKRETEGKLLDIIRTAEAAKPNSVLILIRANNGLDDFITDDGFDEKAATIAVEKFKSENPEMFNAMNSPGSPSNARGKQPPEPQREEYEELMKSLRSRMRL